MRYKPERCADTQHSIPDIAVIAALQSAREKTGENIMSCSTLLVGKKASYDGSTMIARTDDGHFDVKKLTVVRPEDQPRTYKTVTSHLEIELPEHPLRYTSTPNVDPSKGIWAANGINEANVGMTATETISSNPRVMGADPMVVYRPAGAEQPEIPGGIGEEDMVVIVLPYIRSAREGVLRLGALLEQYGTYECNGIAFNDADEIWWMETIGGHHWAARRVADETCVFVPNQFGMDGFDFEDAFGAQKDCLCSADLRSFMERNFLDLNTDGCFNTRRVFGSQTDFDHIYNTPRAWYVGRYLNPTRYKWDGEDADFSPESDDIPWSFIPERKIAVEDVAYLLSTHYQGTPYDPYSAVAQKHGLYRPIGISRTGVTAICQIRGYLPERIQAVEWVCFGSTTFGAFVPVYANTDSIPPYLSAVTEDVSTDNYYWNSRLIGAFADANYGSALMQIERYQMRVATGGHRLLNEYDPRIMEEGGEALIGEANEKLCEMARKETTVCLNRVLLTASEHMKNGFNRSDMTL